MFIETKDIVETTLALNNYKRACDMGRGAVFFSIARGKVAEGIDFDRHYGRCVVIFGATTMVAACAHSPAAAACTFARELACVLAGIPFQYTLSHVLRARLTYLHNTFGIREQDFLTFDAIRQSSQCVGRIIRSKKDYGIIVFADKRCGQRVRRAAEFAESSHTRHDPAPATPSRACDAITRPCRYQSHDKRSKLPQWVLQFLPDAHANLQTTIAIDIARRFLKEMAQPGGFNIEVQTIPHDQYLANVWRKGNFYIGTFNMQPHEDALFTLLFTGDAPWNDTKWDSQRFDELVYGARRITDEARRRAMYSEAQKLLVEQIPYLIPFYEDLISVTRSHVAGYTVHPRGGVFFLDHTWMGEGAPRRG